MWGQQKEFRRSLGCSGETDRGLEMGKRVQKRPKGKQTADFKGKAQVVLKGPPADNCLLNQ